MAGEHSLWLTASFGATSANTTSTEDAVAFSMSGHLIAVDSTSEKLF